MADKVKKSMACYCGNRAVNGIIMVTAEIR